MVSVKIALALAATAALLGGLTLAWRALHPPRLRARRHIILQIIQITSAIAFGVLAWGILLTRTNFVQTLSLYKWHARDVVMLRLSILLGALFMLEVFLLSGGLLQIRKANWKKFIAEARSSANALAWTLFGILALCAAAIAATGIGIRAPYNWYEAGVPILGAQMAIAILLAFILPAVWKAARAAKIRQTDLAISLLIWAGTALWWQSTHHAPSFFAPAPMPPTFQPYPYSDAASWDTTGWQLLLGMHPNPLTDHLGLSGLLALGHLLVGFNYWRLISLQVAVLALLPVAVYWVGQGMGSRTAGAIAAWLVAAQGVNAIQSGKMLNHVSPKALMTEYPTALALAVLTLTLVMFGQASNKKQRRLWLIPMGAALGVGVMFRYSVLAFVPAVVAGIFLLQWKRLKCSAIASALVLAIAMLTIAPWMWRSQVLANKPFFFISKTQRLFTPNYRSELPHLHPQMPTPKPSSSITKTPSARPEVGTRAIETAKPKPSRAKRFAQYYAHNLATSFLTLPLMPRFADLKETVNTFPFFKRQWFTQHGGGGFTKAMWLYSGVYMLILALGIAAAYREIGLAGWVPLGAMLTYHAATALVNTGGGRYLVPVQWVLFLYLGVGLTVIVSWFYAAFSAVPPLKAKVPAFSISTSVALGLALPWISLVLWMGIHDATTPSPYMHTQTAKAETLAKANSQPFPKQEIQAFAKSPRAVIAEGIALYPRFFTANDGIPEGWQGYRIMPFSRVAFIFSHTPGKWGVAVPAVLPTNNQNLVIEGKKVLLFGCWVPPRPITGKGYPKQFSGYIKVQAVIQNGKVYPSNGALSACPQP